MTPAKILSVVLVLLLAMSSTAAVWASTAACHLHDAAPATSSEHAAHDVGEHPCCNDSDVDRGCCDSSDCQCQHGAAPAGLMALLGLLTSDSDSVTRETDTAPPAASLDGLLRPPRLS